MKQLNLTFYSDSGHGWLKVRRDLIKEIGLLETITNYSYQSPNGNSVYLEEDQDATTVMNKLISMGYVVKTIEVDHGDRSFVRNLQRFQQ